MHLLGSVTSTLPMSSMAPSFMSNGMYPPRENPARICHTQYRASYSKRISRPSCFRRITGSIPWIAASQVCRSYTHGRE